MNGVLENAQPPAPATERGASLATFRLGISLEVGLYVALGVLALVMRLADLGVFPLNNVEAHEALAAWHAVRIDAPGVAPVAHSPLMFAFNSLLFAIGGASELTARLATALAGTVLILLPALWRPLLGRTGALLTSLLLAFSASTLVDARTMSPAIWSMMLAVLGLWLVWRFVQSRRPVDAILATTAGLGVLLLADPAGFVLLLILAVAWLLAIFLRPEEVAEDVAVTAGRAALVEWPWRDALLTAVVTVLVIATLGLTFSGGLTQVGQVLGDGLAGVLARPAGAPFAFPLLALLLYEPLLWTVGAVGVFRALRSDSFRDRFMAGWVIAGLAASLIYAGAGPEYALWLAVPLAVLAARQIAGLFLPIEDPVWNVPGWAVPLQGLFVAALLTLSMANFILVVRRLATTTDLAAVQIDVLHLLLSGTSLLMLVILFFLGGSFWGVRAAARGVGLGFVVCLLVVGLSDAWRVAVTDLDNPLELWAVQPVSRDLGRLRETVIEVSNRDNGTPDHLALIADVPDDGAIAWLLRDFSEMRYVSTIERRTTAPLIIAPESFEPETLGARYLGQDFPLARAWYGNLRWVDVPLWLMFRQAPVPTQVTDRVVVWVREDLYGLPPAPTTSEDFAP